MERYASPEALEEAEIEATLAAHDEWVARLFLVPAVVGGGTRALPDQVRLNLTLAQERRFGGGTVNLCYRPA